MPDTSKNVTAPAGLEIINGKWIEMTGHLNLAADHYAHAFDDLDADLMNQGTSELHTATTELQNCRGYSRISKHSTSEV